MAAHSNELSSFPERLQRFQLTGVVGMGSAGVVYRGYDPQLERIVAIKVLCGPSGADALGNDWPRRPRTLLSEGASLELLSEARAMAQISHPNVLPVYEVGNTGDGVFLVTELVEGSTLREWLEENSDLAARVKMIAQAGAGLAAAHERGLVHRDFKPENVLVGHDGRARVADFGLAGFVDGPLESAGTPAYMAPELWHGDRATIASDVYAFCVVACEAFLGERADASTPRPELEARLAERGLTSEQRRAIAAGLDADPARRPASLLPLLEALARRPARRELWTIGGVALAAIAVGVTVAALSAPDDACDAAPTWSTLWTAQRAQLLTAATKRALGERGAALAATLDASLSAYRDSLAATTMVACGEKPTAAPALACVERRAMVFTALIADLERRGANEGSLDRVAALLPPAQCRGTVEPPSPNDPKHRAAIAELLAAAQAAEGLPLIERRVTANAEQAAAAAARATRARALGERSLEAELQIAYGLSARGDAAAQVAAFDRAYALGFELRLPDLAARAMLEKATITMMRGDFGNAEGILKATLPLLEDSRLSKYARVHLRTFAGELKWRRGEYSKALDELRPALQLAEGKGPALHGVFVSLHLGIAIASGGVDDVGEQLRHVQAAKVVQERYPGTSTHGFVWVMTVYGDALQVAGRRGEALAARRDALAAAEAIAGFNAVFATNLRADLGSAQLDNGRSDEAVVTLERATDEAMRNGKGALSTRGQVMAMLALAYHHAGRPRDALHRAQAAYEDSLVTNGRSSRTAEILAVRGEIELELGQDEQAESHLDAAEAMYREADSGGAKGFVVRIGGELRTRLALSRRQARKAAELADASLAYQRELRSHDYWWYWGNLAGGLADLQLGRLVDATAKLTRAVEIARAHRPAPWELARAELALAQLRAAQRDASWVELAERSVKALEATPHLQREAALGRAWLEAQRPAPTKARRKKR